jgi:hypothetical protein
VNYGVENLAALKFRATLSLLASGRPAAAFMAYAAVNCALVAAAAVLTTQFAPAAAGSGIAEVKVRRGAGRGLAIAAAAAAAAAAAGWTAALCASLGNSPRQNRDQDNLKPASQPLQPCLRTPLKTPP